MSRFLATLLSLLLAGCALTGNVRSHSDSTLAGTHRRFLETENGRRSYWLHVPPGNRQEGPLPLLIVLHGHGGTGRRMMRLTGLNRLADEEGLLVAYPDGESWWNIPWGSWNAGYCCGYAQHRQVNDLDFLNLLMDDLQEVYPVDSRQVSIIGVSNGGMMAYRAGCALAERLSAIWIIAGAMPPGPCEPETPLSVMIVHGTEDSYVLYHGGDSPKSGYKRRDASVEDAVRFWVNHNRLSMTPDRLEQGAVIEERYQGDDHRIRVILYTIQGAGHHWPGRRVSDPFSINERIGEMVRALR